MHRYLDEIARSSALLVQRAERAGWEASVPTCPDWSVADLVAHQGMVHRWARANLLAEDAPFVRESEVLDTVGLDALASWFREGVAFLVETLRSVDPEVQAMVFLADAGPPREFWARRQTFETTIHAVDALSADLGRIPTADEAGIDRDLALDGIDELLCGFVPRDRSRLRSDESYTLAVRPDDSDRGWRLSVSLEPVVTERVRDAADSTDATIAGSAAQLLLGLWNRGDELAVGGRPGVLDAWRALQRVTWG